MISNVVRYVFIPRRSRGGALAKRTSAVLRYVKRYAISVRRVKRSIVIDAPAFTFAAVEPMLDAIASGDVRVQLLEYESASLATTLSALKRRHDVTPAQRRAVLVKALRKPDSVKRVTSLAAPAQSEYDALKRALRDIKFGREDMG